MIGFGWVRLGFCAQLWKKWWQRARERVAGERGRGWVGGGGVEDALGLPLRQDSFYH